MESQTSLVARQTRLSEWAEQIKACQNRPEGMKVAEWCAQNGITKANYYWRLRQVRAAYLGTVPDTPSFVELPVSQPSTAKDTMNTEYKTIAVLKGKGQITMEITEQISPVYLKAIVEAINHA